MDVKAGDVAPGVNGGFQARVKSPMNKGRFYGLPGIGLAGDWPGGWTQTYAQIDTEAGALGFDKDYFVRQVAGLTQLSGELMLVDPVVIDLGWGKLKSALVKLKDSAFFAPLDATGNRRMLGDQYVAAFRQVEVAARDKAGAMLKDLASSISARVVPEQQHELHVLVDEQRAKLA